MPKTDTQDRELSGKMVYGLHRDPCFSGRAGPGRDDHTVRPDLLDLIQGNLVITVDDQLFTQFPQILNKVVGKGVIIVDH
jgi:hypothetical protein